LKSGTLSPNPWDLTLSGQNVWPYTGGTRTEDKAGPVAKPDAQLIQDKLTGTSSPVVKGCDLSAGSVAGMAWAAAMLRPPQNTQTQTRPGVTYFGPNLGLTKGSPLLLQSFVLILFNTVGMDGNRGEVNHRWPSRLDMRFNFFDCATRRYPSRAANPSPEH